MPAYFLSTNWPSFLCLWVGWNEGTRLREFCEGFCRDFVSSGQNNTSWHSRYQHFIDSTHPTDSWPQNCVRFLYLRCSHQVARQCPRKSNNNSDKKIPLSPQGGGLWRYDLISGDLGICDSSTSSPPQLISVLKWPCDNQKLYNGCKERKKEVCKALLYRATSSHNWSKLGFSPTLRAGGL